MPNFLKAFRVRGSRLGGICRINRIIKDAVIAIGTSATSITGRTARAITTALVMKALRSTVAAYRPLTLRRTAGANWSTEVRSNGYIVTMSGTGLARNELAEAPDGDKWGVHLAAAEPWRGTSRRWPF